MYEDSSIELDAFRPGGRVLCIASAGCTAMKLAPDHEVVAVDINPVQLAYAERRLNGDPGFRGRAERVMDFARFFAPLAGWWPSRVRTFVELDDPAEQMEYWQRNLNTWRFRAALDGLFSLTALRSVYSSPLLDFLPKRLGAVMRARMERCFARHPNRSNPYVRSLAHLPRKPRTFGSCMRTRRAFSKTNRPPASMASRCRTFWMGSTRPTGKRSLQP
jgi:S-adenosylmethionine:diacylglycerol 3-amino-3-carboxypropyl transferase